MLALTYVALKNTPITRVLAGNGNNCMMAHWTVPHPLLIAITSTHAHPAQIPA